MKRKHLSINEKRDWLAQLFRDDSGEVSQAEKFKAMVEDTRLAMLPDEKAAAKQGRKTSADAEAEKFKLFEHLPPPL